MYRHHRSWRETCDFANARKGVPFSAETHGKPLGENHERSHNEKLLMMETVTQNDSGETSHREKPYEKTLSDFCPKSLSKRSDFSPIARDRHATATCRSAVGKPSYIAGLTVK
jgi:hypothetical protein